METKVRQLDQATTALRKHKGTLAAAIRHIAALEDQVRSFERIKTTHDTLPLWLRDELRSRKGRSNLTRSALDKHQT
jgi:hypothetical protein